MHTGWVYEGGLKRSLFQKNLVKMQKRVKPKFRPLDQNLEKKLDTPLLNCHPWTPYQRYFGKKHQAPS